jgi:ribosome-binding protein aMBF1 (putative translation factor)
LRSTERNGKSIHAASYRVFLKVLRDSRHRAGLSQAQVAERIGETQTFVNKCERKEGQLMSSNWEHSAARSASASLFRRLSLL